MVETQEYKETQYVLLLDSLAITWSGDAVKMESRTARLNP